MTIYFFSIQHIALPKCFSNVSQEEMKNPVSSLYKRTYGIYIVPRLGDANTELEQMIMYLETFKIVCYHLILSALYEYRFPESFSLI